MKEIKLTEIMLKSLKKDPSLASADEWENAGDYAMEVRFFPHAFNCYHLAMSLDKDPAIAEKTNDVLDKITNVLEILPAGLKEPLEEFRLNNPLDPSKWLELSNKLLKQDPDSPSARLALAFTAYCSLRSHFDVLPILAILDRVTPPIDQQTINTSLSIQKPEGHKLKVVAFGDNVTLGLQGPWEFKFNETYHYLWAKEQYNKGIKIDLANCGTSGAGAMDALLYLGRDVINYKPDLVFVNFGLNDTWLGHQALPAYEIVMEAVIKLIQDQTDVILITPTPHIAEACPENERPTNLEPEELAIEPWVEACRRVALRTGVTLADAYAEFPREQGTLTKYLANGFNQLNLEGHKLVQKAIDKVLKIK